MFTRILPKMGILAYKVAKIIKPLVFKPQCLITWENSMFLWPHSNITWAYNPDRDDSPTSLPVDTFLPLTVSRTPNPDHMYFKLHPLRYCFVLLRFIFPDPVMCLMWKKPGWSQKAVFVGIYVYCFVSMVIFLPVNVICWNRGLLVVLFMLLSF